MTPTGKFACDRCDADVGNGGVDRCAIVSDLDPVTGAVRNLHFCLDRVGDDGATVRGCAHRLLSPSMIAAYTARQESSRD
jgi:hypothetical protein